MKDLLDKLSTYNIFNYLFPGSLFVVILDKVTSYSLIQKDIVIGVFVYYFIGLVISRFGSLIVEPLLKKLTFLSYSDYSEFVSASNLDQKIELLSEQNNMYRTLISMLIILLLLKGFESIVDFFPILIDLSPLLLFLILILVFLFSLKKQSNYITKRIRNTK